jgi:alanyl-tRNA synthetase
LRRRILQVPTTRLYYDDPYLSDFQCNILRCEPSTRNSSPTPLYEAVTDVTAFYPNSGGQPSDRGILAGADVVDVVERDGEIIHLTVGSVPLGLADGRVDIERRFDHMQQHTGQHILSAAFANLFGLDTVGFHLGDETATIDLPICEISNDQAAAAEMLACEVVFQNRPVTTTFRKPCDVDESYLRKLPNNAENIRLVEIDGFDINACCGTHVRATGEVGLIKIIGIERIRSVTRVEFVCGRRALADYRWKNDVVHLAASQLSIHGKELPEAMLRLQNQIRQGRRGLEEALDRLRDYEAEEIYSAAVPLNPSGVRVIALMSQKQDIESVRAVAQKISCKPKVAAFLGCVNGESANLVFARSNDIPLDMSELLQQALPAIDGKGGGSPAYAQGGGKNPDGIPEALALVAGLAKDALG